MLSLLFAIFYYPYIDYVKNFIIFFISQFEIVKFRKGDDDKDLSVNGKCPYFRILIKRR